MTTIDGGTFIPKRDSERLGKQYRAVASFFRSQGENWSTLQQIAGESAKLAGRPYPYPEASVSARFRDLKKAGWATECQYVVSGLHRYRAFPPDWQGHLL